MDGLLPCELLFGLPWLACTGVSPLCKACKAQVFYISCPIWVRWGRELHIVRERMESQTFRNSRRWEWEVSHKIHNEPILQDPQWANPTQQQSISSPISYSTKIIQPWKITWSSPVLGSATSQGWAFLYLLKARCPRVSPHQSHDGWDPWGPSLWLPWSPVTHVWNM